MLEQHLAGGLRLPSARPVWHAGTGSPIVATGHTEHPPGRRRR